MTGPHPNDEAPKQNDTLSTPRRIAVIVGDWSRTVVVVAFWFIVLLAAITAVYLAGQGMLFLVQLFRSAFAIGD